MTEFQELVKDAPKFASMERSELVTCAYAMYAAGAKTDAENAKLRELVRMMLRVAGVAEYATDSEWQIIMDYLRELGEEVSE